MNNIFHYDYFSLKGVPIPEWSNSFFWPVAPQTTHALVCDLIDEQTRLINELGDGLEGDCLLSAYFLFANAARTLNHLLAVTRLKEQGVRITHSDRLKLLPALLNPPAGFTFSHEDVWAEAREHRIVRSLKDTLFSVRYNMRREARWWPPSSQKTAVSFPNEYVLNRSYTRSLDERVKRTSPEEWLCRNNKSTVPPGVSGALDEVADQYFAFVSRYAQDKLGLKLSGGLSEALADCGRSYLRHVASVCVSVDQLVQRQPLSRLLTPTAGKTFVRALSLAVRRHGGKVTGFPHGYFIGHSASHRPHFHEFATVDEFVAYTPGSATLMERNLEVHPPPRANRVRFLNDNSHHFKNIYDRYQRVALPDRIRTVMVLEDSLFLEDARHEIPESLVHYHFCYRVCSILAENGYKIIFKRRPKAMSWGDHNIFSGIPGLEIEYRPLESPGVIDQADAILLHYGLSSTLIFAMCTNKTVIYADNGLEPWYPDVHECMSQRCRVLPCWFDESNRQCFDEGELLRLVGKPPEAVDTEFLERYLFPQE